MRKKPYTEIGILRKKCFRCSARAKFQWQICADDNIWRPLCADCDIKLNEMVLRFMKFKNWKKKVEDYRKYVEK